MEMLAIPFVICKEKSLLFAQRSAKRRAELIALKWRGRSLIEVIRRIENVVSQEVICGAVQLVCSGLGDDDDLRAGTLSVFSAIGIAKHVEFADSLDASSCWLGPPGCMLFSA